MSNTIISQNTQLSYGESLENSHQETNNLNTVFSLLKTEMHEPDHVAFFTERALSKEDSQYFRFGYHNGAPAVAIPFKDIYGNIQSIQWVFKNKEGAFLKQNFKGTKISGSFFALDDLDVTEDTTIYICEGSRTGLSLKKLLPIHQNGKVFCAGPASNIPTVAKIFQERFSDVTIIAAPDADEAGNLAAIECKKLGVPSVFPPQERRGYDWNDVVADNGTDQSKEIFENALAIDGIVFEKMKFFEDLQRGAFPVEAFPKEASAFITEVSEKMQVDLSVVGTQALATIALVCQNSGDVIDGFQSTPLSLNVLISAASGERKTASQKEILKAVRRFEKTGFLKYETEMKEYKIKKKRWEKMINKKSSENENIEDLLATEPQRPMNPKMIMQDPTVEGVIMQFKIGREALGLFTDEGAKLFGGYSMSKEKALSAVGHLSNFWDGTPVERTRAGDEDSFTLQDKRLTSCIMTQPDIFYSVWDNELFQKQGFLPRFLIVDAKSKEGERFHIFTEEPQIFQHSRDFHQRIEHLMEFPHKYKNITLSLEARKAKVDFQKEIEDQLGLGGKYHPIAGYANKCAEQATRIAGNLHLFGKSPLEFHSECTEISLEEFERGKALAQWYLDEALRIFMFRAEGMQDNQSEKIMTVLKRVLKENGGEPVSVRTLSRRMPRTSERKVESLKKTLLEMEKNKVVIQKDGNWLLAS